MNLVIKYQTFEYSTKQNIDEYLWHKKYMNTYTLNFIYEDDYAAISSTAICPAVRNSNLPPFTTTCCRQEITTTKYCFLKRWNQK